MKIEKPLLAGTAKDYSKIKYPVIGSPKLDGIRCLIIDGKAVSRNFKEIPNKFIAKDLPTLAPNGFDGELLLKGNKPFNEVSSAVMSFDGEPEYEYHIFDYVTDNNIPYSERIKVLKESVNSSPKLVIVPTYVINNEDELNIAEEDCINKGYEGLMIRSPNGIYKFGRSSEKEGILLKIKRFEDSEAEILDFEEKMSNQNEKEQDVFGNSTRASKKEFMVPAGVLGAVKVRDIKTGVEFKIGSGFDDEYRKKIWDNQSNFLGKLVKYKFQPSGAKDLPRFPVFLGFRHENDL